MTRHKDDVTLRHVLDFPALIAALEKAVEKM